MLKILRLKELLRDLPDDAGVIAYEGEGIGLCVIKGDAFGWIETGYSLDVECDEHLHDLSAFTPDGAKPAET